MMTFSQGRGHDVGSKVKKQHYHMAGKLLINVTVTTFGTMVLCGKVLQNIHCTVTFIQGQGHIRAVITKLNIHVSLMGFALLVLCSLEIG